MRRFHQILLIGTFLPLCWFGMMIVHEVGHVVGAWATGGAVSKVVLHPLEISRTDVERNPHPLFVVWAGPMVGIVVPLLAYGAASVAKWPGTYLLRFFAGFCLIANGAYIGFGSLDRVGDAGDMLRNGSSNGQLWLFGTVTIPAGFLLWHRLGPHFGLGESNGRVNPLAAYVSTFLLALVVFVELLLDWR